MRSFFGLFVLILGIAFAATAASAQMMDNSGNPMVGGAAMYKTKNIVENAVKCVARQVFQAPLGSESVRLCRPRSIWLQFSRSSLARTPPSALHCWHECFFPLAAPDRR